MALLAKPLIGLTQSMNVLIMQVGHPDMMTSLKALDELIPVIDDRNISHIMLNHIDTLLGVVSMKLRSLHSSLPSSPPRQKGLLDRHYMSVFSLLKKIFQPTNQILLKMVTQGTLREMVLRLLEVLVDCNVNALTHGKSIFQALGILVVDIIKSCEPHSIICGLVGLLNVTLENGVDKTLMELVIKCEAQLLKLFPKWKENDIRFGRVELEIILREFHAFIQKHSFKSTGPENVLQIRTMKLILKQVIIFVGKKDFEKGIESLVYIRGAPSEMFFKSMLNAALEA